VDLSRDGGKGLKWGEETLFVNASIMNVFYRPKNAPWLVDLDLPVADVDTPELASHNDIANYVIYPRDTMDQYQATVITSLLHGLVADKTRIYCSDTAERTLFWAAPLSSANAQRVESDPNVRFWALAIYECALTDDFRSLRLSKSKKRLRTAMTLLIVDSES